MRFSWKNSQLHVMYNMYDEMGKGRCAMLYSVVAQNIISWLSGSLFYTSFLLQNGINLVNIGIITFVPYIANCFTIFIPFVLEKFRSRRWLLAVGRASYYTLYILGITVLTPMIENPSAKVAVFVAITFVANIINAMCNNGYSVWHLNFIPGGFRAGYFSSSTAIASYLGIGLGLLGSVVADALAGSAHEYTIIVVFRYIAYALGMLEAILLALPKEFPYPQTRAPRITDIFSRPLRQKKFMMTMLIMFLYNMGVGMTSGCLNAYLLDTVGVSFTFIQLINFMYPVFLTIFSRHSQNNIRRLGWYKAFAFFILLQFPTTLAYSFVTASNFWILMPIVRLIQHYTGSTANIAAQNLQFINATKEGQTNFLAFNTIVTSLGAFLGVSLATSFIAANPTLSLNVLGMNFCNVQVLMLAQAMFELCVPFLVLFLAKKFDLENGEAY